ncbi:hypothetical protein LMG2828_05848 [Achromobacter piechaudii]|uniref:hypothetical protein n=1 Tax=Achromobacter piechaudii TaxID=72556 RepID=UPI0014693FC4|nr:hypothetical protein [Achromobacter piechaudii]CAB3924146.1 hypothetical protein LMG2828_05848 [Achromobacter piechaudii]
MSEVPVPSASHYYKKGALTPYNDEEGDFDEEEEDSPRQVEDATREDCAAPRKEEEQNSDLLLCLM